MRHDYSKYINNNITELNNTILNNYNLKLEYHEMTGDMKEFSTMYLIYTDPLNNNNSEKTRSPAGNNHYNFERIIIFYKMLELLKNTSDLNSEIIVKAFGNVFYKF